MTHAPPAADPPVRYLAWPVLIAWLAVAAIALPLLFLLFALPLPVSAQNVLQNRLQNITTSAASTMLPFLGIVVQQKGHVLSLPSGDLGVVEACSGVRGVTAIIAVAAFVAY